jgi:hypothetical protein
MFSVLERQYSQFENVKTAECENGPVSGADGNAGLRMPGAGYRVGLPFGRKKSFHQGGAFQFQYAGGNDGFGVKWRAAGYPAVAVLIIGGAPNNTADFTPVQGPGTHEAGLHRYIYRGFGQVFAAQEIKGRSEGNHFSMGCYIGQFFGLVVAAGNDFTVYHHHRANGYFIFLKSQLRLFKGLPHKMLIVGRGNDGEVLVHAAKMAGRLQIANFRFNVVKQAFGLRLAGTAGFSHELHGCSRLPGCAIPVCTGTGGQAGIGRLNISIIRVIRGAFP